MQKSFPPVRTNYHQKAFGGRGLATTSTSSATRNSGPRQPENDSCQVLRSALDYEEKRGFTNSPGKRFATFQDFLVAELGAMQDSLGSSSELSQRVKSLRAAACQYTSLSNNERKQLAENLRCMATLLDEADRATAINQPSFQLERVYWQQGVRRVAGVDEVGRGPLAGPVVAAACVLREGVHLAIPGINDSKKLSPKKRDMLYAQLTEHPEVEYCIAMVGPRKIDELNINQASLLAMHEAYMGLENGPPEVALVDGSFLPQQMRSTSIEGKHVIHGDALSLSIAAASIIAKVTRDRMMVELDEQFPMYAFAQHKGYGTKAHNEAILQHGPCIHHRWSYSPIKKYPPLER